MRQTFTLIIDLPDNVDSLDVLKDIEASDDVVITVQDTNGKEVHRSEGYRRRADA